MNGQIEESAVAEHSCEHRMLFKDTKCCRVPPLPCQKIEGIEIYKRVGNNLNDKDDSVKIQQTMTRQISQNPACSNLTSSTLYEA